MPKRSRLEVKNTSVQFSNGEKQNGGHLKTGPKFCPKNDHSKTGWSGNRFITVSKKANQLLISLSYFFKFFKQNLSTVRSL
jgi:hypothetical protein